MKLWDCLPKAVGDKLRGVTNLREIRLRNDKPVKVNVGGQWYTVGDKGLFATDKNAPLLDETCDDIVKRACNNSVYAYEKMLAKGFLRWTTECAWVFAVKLRVQASRYFANIRRYVSVYPIAYRWRTNMYSIVAKRATWS